MITFGLVSFVKKHLEKNTPEQEIIDVLSVHGGWVDEDIDHAFFLARHGIHNTSNQNEL